VKITYLNKKELLENNQEGWFRIKIDPRSSSLIDKQDKRAKEEIRVKRLSLNILNVRPETLFGFLQP
jgi:hypothetical protein